MIKNFQSMSFIDLFAGIGGIRLGFENIAGECVFSSEWDKYAQITYKGLVCGRGQKYTFWANSFISSHLN